MSKFWKIIAIVLGGIVLLFIIVGARTDSSPTPIQTTQTSSENISTSSENELSQNESVPEVVSTETKSAQNLFSVVSVVDGDTVKVNINGSTETIRLIGINTPETVDPRKPVECFGTEASNKAKSVLTGSKVSVETDASQGERDKYNRLLAYIFLEDGTNFNKMMIAEGYAYEYTYNTPYKYQSEFKSAETQAKNTKVGLWADGVCDSEPVTTDTSSQTTQQGTAYECSYNAYNCSDFQTHNEAQQVFNACGGTSNDIHRLDQDKDGMACETLP